MVTGWVIEVRSDDMRNTCRPTARMLWSVSGNWCEQREQRCCASNWTPTVAIEVPSRIGSARRSSAFDLRVIHAEHAEHVSALRLVSNVERNLIA